jgi:ATP-dependent protease ClpP protease subunit
MKKILNYIKQSFLGRTVSYLIRNPFLIVVIILLVITGKDKGVEWYDEYMVLYEEANNKIEEEENTGGLEWKKIDDQLYTLMGTVKEGDCEKITPQMPDGYFTVILESPGGNLADGSCLAAHMKLRNVVTVVRSTPVLNQLGETIYTPGTNVDENTPDYMRGKSVCASACGLLFLAGDKRYLIGNVYFGIHGPGTPPGSMNGASASAIESSAFRTASSLLKLLKSLGVEDEDLRMLFIQIPNATMYWLHPRDFKVRPALVTIATDYRDFFGTTGSDPEGGMR